MAHGATEQGGKVYVIDHQTGMGSVGIVNVSLGKDVGTLWMTTLMMSRAREGERSQIAIAKEGGVENILMDMMSVIMVDEDLVGPADQVFIQMMKATAEREQNRKKLTKGGKKSMGERNVGLQILMILKKTSLVDLKATLRASHTAVIIQIPKTPGVKAKVGEVGEGSVPVLVLPNSQMQLGHWETLHRQMNESKLNKLR